MIARRLSSDREASVRDSDVSWRFLTDVMCDVSAGLTAWPTGCRTGQTRDDLIRYIGPSRDGVTGALVTRQCRGSKYGSWLIPGSFNFSDTLGLLQHSK